MHEDYTIEQRCIEVYAKNKSYRFINKDDMLAFVRKMTGEKIPAKTKKDTLAEMFIEQMKPDNLQLFNKVENFGLTNADIQECLGISKYMVNKYADEEKLNIASVYRSTYHTHLVYYIYDMQDVIAVGKSGSVKKKKVFDYSSIELSDRNIAEALYNINKSAKVSRDTKNHKYNTCCYSECKASKTRMLNLYNLKDVALKKMISEKRAIFCGYDVQENTGRFGRNFFELYRIDDFTFHMPIDYPPDGAEIRNELNGSISAEKKISTTLNFNQSIAVLERYTNEKAFGKYNEYYYD